MRRHALLAVCTIVALSACNSTNHLTSSEIAGTETSAAAREGGPAVGGKDATGVAGSGSRGASSSTGTVGSTAGQPGSTAPGSSGENPGAAGDTTAVRLGFITIDLRGAETVVSGLGTQVSFGNGQQQAQAVVDELNATGGIAGRKVEPFFAEVDVASDGEGNYIAACLKLTEDDKVFAIVTPLNVTQSFVDCAAKHNTPVINVSFNPGDDELFRMYKDHFFSPSLMSLDRGSKLMLEQLRNKGGLGAGQKIGLFTIEDPQLRRVSDRTVKPLLRSWKVPFVELVAATEADVAEAVLRFRTDGVTRVMFEAPNGIAQILFMNQADRQGYEPKYSFWDPDSPRFVSETAPLSQVRNITGIGALPLSDVPPPQYPPGPAEKRCIDILNKRNYRTADRNSNLTATLYCEGTWVFAEGVKRVPGPLSVEAWRAGYRATGKAYDPVSTFSADFGSGRNDNSSEYRPLAFDGTCNCMRYTGPAAQAPA